MHCVLQLAMEYAEDYHVEMVPEKTKLISFTPKGLENYVYYQRITSPISVAGQKISFSNDAEHVGIVRSSSGNMPNVLARQSAHTRALYGVMSSGLAKAHFSNPSAALKLERVYGTPVLLSGLASLVLAKSELATLDQHYKVSLERIQRHYQATPRCVVFFMAGSLPAQALLHMRQLSLLGLIARLGSCNILFQHGWSTLLSDDSSFSWFHQIRLLSQQYSLPDPLYTLANPLPKATYKRTVKLQVLDWWQSRLRYEAAQLHLSIYVLGKFHVPVISTPYLDINWLLHI